MSCIRAILRKLILPALCSLALTAQAAQTLTVTTTADDVTTPPAGSLRKAIADAANGDTIDFNASVTGAITLAGAELVLDKNLTITGPGAATLAISGNQQSRVLKVPAGKTVAISGLSIRDGKAANGLNGSAVNLSPSVPGGSGQHGGGVLNEGTLTCTGCWFTNSSAGNGGSSSGGVGGATGGSGGSGGGVFNAGTLTLESCILGTNRAGAGGWGASERSHGEGGRGGDGGAIHSSNGVVHLLNCHFYGNTAGDGGGTGYSFSTMYGSTAGNGGDGGCVSFAAGTVAIEGCSLTQGSAGKPGSTQNGTNGRGGSGGGIFIAAASADLKSCTISGNAAGDAQPVGGSWGGDGGGIACNGGALNLTSCTVSDNVAGENPGPPSFVGQTYDGSGGGVYVTASTVTVQNSIIAGNRNTFGPAPFLNHIPGPTRDVSGGFISAGHNLIGWSNGSTGFAHGTNGDIVGTQAAPVDPKHGPLSNYGGSTLTHILLPDSPARDSGDDSITGTDQRGQPRLVGPHVDIGAVEGLVQNLISFAVDGVEAQEAAGPITIVIQRTGDIASTASVQYSMSGTATDGADYTASSSTLQFAAGQTDAVINVPILDDATVEGPETILVRLSSSSANAVVYPHSELTITVFDDEGPGILQFAIAESTVAENVGNALVTVVRKNGAVGTVAVKYQSVVSGTLIFGPGVTQQTISVPIIDDSTFGTKTYSVTLSEPTGGATLGAPATHVITAIDNDPPPPPPTFNFEVAANSVSESGGNVVITVVRSVDLEKSVSVSYQTSAGTAGANSDFVPAAGILNFPFSSTEQTIVVPIANDDVIENTETFTVALSDPTNEAVLGTQATHTVTITDDDGPATIAFANSSSSVDESSGQAVVTLIRSGSTASSASVQVSASNGSAALGSDYPLIAGTVTFPPGVSERTVTFSILDDADEEGDEQFQLVLSNPTEGATLGAQNSHTIIILANDPPAIVAFASASSSATELLTIPAYVDLVRSGNTATSATVQVSAQPGSAHDGTDYTFESSTVTFAPGETQKIVMVSIVDDTVDEGDEEFQLVLSNPGSGVALGSTATHTITILDDAGDLPEFAKASYHGLATSRDPAPDEYAGISVKTTDSGQLTGTVQVRGKTVRFRGRFSETGAFTQEFLQKSLGTLRGSSLELQLQSSGAIVDGTFRTFNGTTFDVELKRDVVATNANPVAQANSYTTLLQTDLPGNAAGFLRARVLPTGKITLSGRLPDGTLLSGSSQLAEDRSFPVFFPAYARKLGYLAGTARIVSVDALPLTGDLHWKKPANSRPPYSGGLTDEPVDLSGNVYTPPARRHRALDDFDATQGIAFFQTSTAADPNPVSINAMWNQDNTIRILPPEFRRPPSPIRFSLQPKTGLFTGMFRDAENHSSKFFGICIQQAEAGADQAVGFFRDGETAGRIELVPQPPQQ